MADSEVEIPADVKDSDRLRDLIKSERASAYVWEYRYLGYYLIPATQRLLDIIVRSDTPMALTLLNSVLSSGLLTPNEQGAMVRALVGHHLIKVDNDAIEATPKGREYVEWRGPYPEPLDLPRARALAKGWGAVAATGGDHP